MARAARGEASGWTEPFLSHFTYFTAWAEPDGSLRTYADPYDYDARLADGSGAGRAEGRSDHGRRPYDLELAVAPQPPSRHLSGASASERSRRISAERGDRGRRRPSDSPRSLRMTA